MEVNISIKSRSLIPYTTTSSTPTTSSAEKRKHNEEKMFYFALPSDESQQLVTFSSFEKELLSSVVHTFRLGVHLQQKVDGTASELDQTADGYASLQKFVASALASDFNADKFFPLRLTGSSMKEIARILPLQTGTMTAFNIFQLCIFRAFAFGDKEHIKALTLPQTSPPDVDSLAATITTWGGASNIALPVYGNFQVVKSKVPTMLTLLWEFSQTLHNDYTTRKATGAALTFISVYQALANKKVPSLPAGGVVTWVLASDLVEYGICLAPTEKDLAEHIMPSSKSSRGSPSGPTAGLKHAADTSGEEVPEGADALAKVLKKVMAVFDNPPSKMPTVRKMVKECEEIQGRKINVIDVEHALCKVARQLSEAKGRESKKAKAET